MYLPAQFESVIVPPQAPAPPPPPEIPELVDEYVRERVAQALAEERFQEPFFQAGDAYLVQPELVGLVLGSLTLLLLMVIGYPIAKAIARRMDRGAGTAAAAGSDEVLARLERIEHAVETMAVEIERISEGQRFTTRLFSEHVRERDARGIPAATRGE